MTSLYCIIFVAKWNYATVGDEHVVSGGGSFLLDEIDQTGAATVVTSLSPRLGMSVGMAGAGSGVDGNERFSRKVFVGGLPPDIDEGELVLMTFRFLADNTK